MDRNEVYNAEEENEIEHISDEERKKKIKARFFDCCKKGDVQGLLKIIDDEMLDINEPDDKDWTGLSWAVLNNNTSVVKQLLIKEAALIKEGGGNQSLNGSVMHNIKEDINEVHRHNDYDQLFKKPDNPADKGKYNPLHWACYKGNIASTSLLLKFNKDPMEIDMYGNSALHQAAASNNLDLFRILMGFGIDLEVKNSRNHMPGELTSNKEIKNLINRVLQIKNCQICNKGFDFFVKRFLCNIDSKVICKECCESDYYYDNKDSEDKEIIDCRCKNCFHRIRDVENNIRIALRTNSLKEIADALNFAKSHSVKICPKLQKESELQIDRLGREKSINEHLDNLKEVENHKTIEKSVHVLEQMIKQASDNDIQLASDIVDKATFQKNRLLAEKDLRKILSNLTVEQSSQENLELLNGLLINSKAWSVEDKFCDIGTELSRKIELNLATKKLLDLLLEYPVREYPKIEEVDPKKRSKKLVKLDVKAAEKPKPKKKKKEPPFIIPEWAKERKALIEQVDVLKGYLGMQTEIGLDEGFIQKAKEQLVRFDNEVKFRKHEEDMKNLEDEKKKKNKKKK